MRPGDVVADRFVIEREIASGGMGTIHRAHDRDRSAIVALKVMIGDDPSAVARFERESQLLSELDHPAVVRYVAHGLTQYGTPFLAMEWLEGEDLASRLARGPLPIEGAVDAARRVAQALSALHRRGLVHRDVKPSNVFLVGGDPSRAKLLDLGVARRIRQADALTGTGIAIGTPYYMAPEQARAARDLDARVDVFALGAVLFESIAGRPPFAGNNLVEVLGKIVLEPAKPLSELVREVPSSLDAIVARCLEKDREQRFEHGGALADALSFVDARSIASVPSQSRAIGSSERRVVTVLLVGRADPLAATMAQHASADAAARVREVIASHRATTEHLVDGSYIVALSEPAVPIDQAARAAKMALAVRAAVPELPLAIATGRAELTGAPVGDAVSRAAHALSYAHGGAIRLDEEAASLLGLRFEIERDDRGPILAAPAAGARRLLGRVTPFVGRDRELALLEGLFRESLEEERARCAIVTAPAGSGKSRLLEELVARLRGLDESVEILSGIADVQRAGAPFGALSSLLRRAAEIYDGEPLEVRHRKLRARLSRSLAGAALEGALPFLGEVCGAPFPEDASEALRAARRDPVLMSDHAIESFEQLVAAECARHPVVLVLDDLHWGDLPSVRAVDAALRALADRRLFVLLLARPEVHDLFPRLLHQREAQEVRLGAIGRRACERLIVDALGERATADVVSWIVERAQGNAFFVEELIRAAAASANRDVPDTVLGVVQARLDALGPDAKRALRAGSVFGGTFWKSGVELLAGEGAVEGALQDLIDHEVVATVSRGRFPDETELSFRHALIRDAAYAMLTDDDRSFAHLRAAEWLEARGAQDPAEIAQHREHGGDLPGAAILWSRAAALSLELDDLATANERAERGVACGARGSLLGELRLTQTVAAMWRGDHRAAGERSEQSVASLETGSRAWFRAAAEGVAAAGRLGDREAVEMRVERLLATDAAEDARNEQVIALARTFVPASNAGLAVTERALRRAVEVGEAVELGPIARAQLSEARGLFAAMHGRAEEAERLLLAAIEAYAEGGAARDRCLTQSSLAWSYLAAGHLDRADAAVDASQAMAAEMRIQTGEAWATHMRGMSLMFRERHAEAHEKLTRAVEIFAGQKNARQEGWALAALARVHLALGDVDGAVRESRRSIELLATNPIFLHWPHAVMCRALLALGRVDEALEEGKRAVTVLETQAWAIDRGHAMRAYVEALLAHGDAAAAERAREAGVRMIRAAAEAIQDSEWRAAYVALVDHRWLLGEGVHRFASSLPG